jgi:hypothetical protein
MEAVTVLDELWDSVKRGKPNNAPGEDCINQECFKVVLGTIKQELLEVVNRMHNNGISDNQKHGVMVCVPKTLRTTRPEEFRHLTLKC